MSDAYICERLFRTETTMLHAFDGLRERLHEAFDVGLGTIPIQKFEDLGSADLTRRAEQIFAKLSRIKPDGESWAAASLNEMSDEEVIRTAHEISDLISLVRDWIDSGKKEVKP